MCIWIKNAPEYGEDCDEDIIKFVDSYVSCKADPDDLSDLVNLQRHKHSKLSLEHTTLLLKRSPSEIRINCYNPRLLKAWQANMDIQFVLDPYTCAVYILSYITKG